MHVGATEVERTLLAQNMESGSISVFLSHIHGEYTDLNSTLYGALDVWVDGMGNDEVDIRLRDGATSIYDYWAEDGFVIVGWGRACSFDMDGECFRGRRESDDAGDLLET
jgi:hypothetical protein